jgi:hypothetical protein
VDRAHNREAGKVLGNAMVALEQGECELQLASFHFTEGMSGT